MALVAIYLAVTFAAVWLAQLLANHKSRSQLTWMWASAVFPPAVFVLAMMPPLRTRRPA